MRLSGCILTSRTRHQAAQTLPLKSQQCVRYARALAQFFKPSIKVNKNLIKRGHSTTPVDYLDERTSHFACAVAYQKCNAPQSLASLRLRSMQPLLCFAAVSDIGAVRSILESIAGILHSSKINFADAQVAVLCAKRRSSSRPTPSSNMISALPVWRSASWGRQLPHLSTDPSPWHRARPRTPLFSERPTRRFQPR
jgi:hypothetical protein